MGWDPMTSMVPATQPHARNLRGFRRSTARSPAAPDQVRLNQEPAALNQDEVSQAFWPPCSSGDAFPGAGGEPTVPLRKEEME